MDGLGEGEGRGWWYPWRCCDGVHAVTRTLNLTTLWSLLSTEPTYRRPLSTALHRENASSLNAPVPPWRTN